MRMSIFKTSKIGMVILLSHLVALLFVITDSLSINVNNSNSTLINALNSINKRDSDSSGRYGLGFKLLKTELIDGLQKLQLSMNEKNLNCMPGSVFYNGTCIYISSKRQKLSWLHAERFCRKLPLNTSFLMFQNDHKYEFIRNEIVKIREKENPIDQLVFFVGYKYFKNEWRWTNNQSLTNTNLTLGKYWWDWSGSHGDCGSIALLKNNELIMRSSPCLSTSGRFICEYSLNPCYSNDICGKHGKCINLYSKFYCDCSGSIFFDGEFCDKLNYRGIQTIIGLVIIIFLSLGVFCNTSLFNRIWHFYFGKTDQSSSKSTLSNPNINQSTATVIFSDQKSDSDTKTQIMNSLTQKLSKKWKQFRRLFRTRNISYFILATLTLALVAVQVTFAHNIVEIEYFTAAKKSKLVKDTCNFFDEYYMFEDLVYLPLALIFLLILYFCLKSRRFNKYIMVKYKNYFKSNFFQDIQNKQKQKFEEIIREKEKSLKEKPCGNCRYFSYKCCTQKFCSCFCCLFCCSCCVPPSSNTRCFIWYCCCLGWKQTDFYRILKSIGNFFYYFFYFLFCCPIWVRLYRLNKKRKEEQIEERKKKRRESKLESGSRTSSQSTDIDLDDDFNEDDYDIKTQDFARSPCPFPSTPFSTTNRAQSAAVYIIYTYDVLNIFMYVYTVNLSSPYIPFYGRLEKTSGILVELIIQFLQVLMIGIKFYPILVVADADPNIFIYFFSMIYMLFIWGLRFFKKSFCNRTEAFVQKAFEKITTDFGGRLRSKIGTNYNISNTVLGLFSDDPNPNEKYMSALKNAIPGVFREFFGKYDQGENSEEAYDRDELLLMDAGYSPSTTTLANYYISSTTALTTTSSVGFRSSIKNKTISKFKSLKGFYYQREEGFAILISILENLPLYITLSYLLMRYGMLFMSSLISLITEKCCLWCKPEKKEPEIAESQTSMDMKSNEDIKIELNRMLSELNQGYQEMNKITEEIMDKRNHNFCYIKSLLGDINLFSADSSRNMSKSIRNRTSFIWNLIETYLYKKIPYMKYSKQYINTYTVAFMVVYFFTLFGFRMSNIFGNALVGTIELVYQLIFRGLLPTLDLDKHNFNTEFRTACALTSLISIGQLLSSIRKFHVDLVKLHRGGKLFNNSIMPKYGDDYQKLIRKRNKTSKTIASDSLHFPGYLIAHLVYGYVLLFLIFFVIIVICKLLFYFDGILQASAQILLPLFILFAFKFIFLKYLIRAVFLRDDSQRITNLAPYYVVSYFNFFFDCFLGLIACMSRIWQTTAISILTLPRLDKSMFNTDNDLVMRRLDKGHLAYLNYVRMEHWYNNPILNGFCEMLIESMLYSQIYKAKFELEASTSVKVKADDANSKAKLILRRSISMKDEVRQYSVIERVVDVFTVPPKPRRSVSYTGPTTTKQVTFRTNFDENPNEAEEEEEEEEIIEENKSETSNDGETFKSDNVTFNYKSYLRLRNLIYLCLLLKNNPSLKKFRYHYIKEENEEEERQRKRKKRAETFQEFYTSGFERFKTKFKLRSRNERREMGVSSSTLGSNLNTMSDHSETNSGIGQNDSWSNMSPRVSGRVRTISA